MKNYFLFIIKTSLDDFRRNKLRTLLTSLGILIGVSAVILLLALGLGFKEYLNNQFEGLGSNIISITPGEMLSEEGNFNFQGGIGEIQFAERDLNLIKNVDKTEYLSPVIIKTVTVKSGESEEIGEIYATNESIFILRNLKMIVGRPFTKAENDKKAKVVVLGPKIADKLFENYENALGKRVAIEELNYKIIGIAEAKGGGGFGGPDFDSFIYAPYKSISSLNPDKTVTNFILKAETGEDIEEIKGELKKRLLRKYKEDEFSVIEQEEILKAVNNIFSIMNMVLVGLAAVSLLVGGIGIMNIMYVGVIERYKEIGIRRSYGATRRDILLQFLTESLFLCLIGGFLAILISYLIVLAVRLVFPAYINLMSILIALGVSTLIGLIFGVLPARQAAYLPPVEAIKYE